MRRRSAALLVPVLLLWPTADFGPSDMLTVPAILAAETCTGFACPELAGHVWQVPSGIGSEEESSDSIDAEGDGVPDDRDQCVGAIPGASGADATGCPTDFDPYAKLSFQDDKQRRWYRRFWTGDCDNLGFFTCLPGRPYWYDVLKRALANKVPAGDLGRLTNRLWSLGRLIGYEWAKENDIRRIDTDDLQVWSGALTTASDLDRTIDRIKAEAMEKLSAPTGIGGADGNLDQS